MVKKYDDMRVYEKKLSTYGVKDAYNTLLDLLGSPTFEKECEMVECYEKGEILGGWRLNDGGWVDGKQIGPDKRKVEDYAPEFEKITGTNLVRILKSNSISLPKNRLVNMTELITTLQLSSYDDWADKFRIYKGSYPSGKETYKINGFSYRNNEGEEHLIEKYCIIEPFRELPK